MLYRQFDVLTFLIVNLTYIGLLGLGMYIWMEYYNGLGIREWLMAALGKVGKKTIKNE
ncbi:MAG: hypothetical protein ACFFKA_18515 [Candidatus Thorarchaeota archaeon]